MPRLGDKAKTSPAYVASLQGLAPTVDMEDLEGQFNELIGKFVVLVRGENKKRVWREMTRYALQLERKRIKAQVNLDGSRFAPRKKKDGSKGPGEVAMFRKILREGAKNKQVRRTWSDEGGQVETLNPIATRHQFGGTEQVKAWTRADFAAAKKKIAEGPKSQRLKNERIRRGDDEPCSKDQARALKTEVKFRRLVLDGKPVPASMANLQRAFTTAQAGMILRRHRINNGKPPKRRWTLVTPPRSVLGLNEQEKSRLTGRFAALVAEYAYFKETMPAQDYRNWAEGFKLSYGDRSSGAGVF